MNKEEEYFDSNKNSFQNFLKTHPYFNATSKTGKSFGTIFVLVVIFGLVFVNWSSLFSLNQNVSIKIGIPLTFFEINLTTPETLPIIWLGLIIDMIIYLLLAYIIDVLCNYLTIKVKDSREKKKPEMYKLK